MGHFNTFAIFTQKWRLILFKWHLTTSFEKMTSIKVRLSLWCIIALFYFKHSLVHCNVCLGKQPIKILHSILFMWIVAFTAVQPLPMGEVRNVLKHLQNLTDYIRIWEIHCIQSTSKTWRQIKPENPRDLFFIFLGKLTSNNRARFLNKNMTFIVTFLLKECLHIKNDLQLLLKIFFQGPAQIVFWYRDKKSKCWS